jgi:hypothetical protein
LITAQTHGNRSGFSDNRVSWHICTFLLYGVSNAAMTFQALDSEDLNGGNRVQVRASLIMADRNDALPEQVEASLSLEPGVSAVSSKVDDTRKLRPLRK